MDLRGRWCKLNKKSFWKARETKRKVCKKKNILGRKHRRQRRK